jgi:uncharacterized protein
MSRTKATLAIGVLLLTAHGVSAAPRKPVRSMLELRRERVVAQRWDLSCGAAALSTILTYDLGDPVAEPEVVATLLRSTDPQRIAENGGFTLLDLKRYATARGHVATGYANVAFPALASLAPAIVPTMLDGKPHFMIFRGFVGDRVHLADPSYGNRTLSFGEFRAIWSPRVAFVVRRSDPSAPLASGDGARAPLVPPAVVRGIAGGRR